MRNEYYDDYEQAEAVKKWLKENGLAIVTGIGLGLGVLFGWRFWESYSAGRKAEAARGYEQLVADLEGGREATTDVLQAFREQHGNPAFVGLAALELSHRAISGRNLDEAARLLEVAGQAAEPAALRNVAGLRLARVQMQAGQLEQALATVERYQAPGFEALAAEIRGDVLLARGDREGAREAYRHALDNLVSGERNLLQLKYDDLTPSLAAAAKPPELAEDAAAAGSQEATAPLAPESTAIDVVPDTVDDGSDHNDS